MKNKLCYGNDDDTIQLQHQAKSKYQQSTDVYIYKRKQTKYNKLNIKDLNRY